jgi:hypothetical protein
MHLFGGSPKVTTTVAPAPQASDTQAQGAADSAAKLAAAQTGGYQSYMKTGGLGVPNVRTSTASLLGL